MEIRTVSACGILSFEEFHVDLDSRLTLVVGPNGAGKSNLGRLLEIVVGAVERSEQDTPDSRQLLDRYLSARRSKLDGCGIEVRLSYRLTESFEKEVVTSLIRACTVSALLGSNYGADTSGVEKWAEGITEDELACLFEAEIVIHHGGTTDSQWECGVEFECAGTAFRWVILGIQKDWIVQAQDRFRPNLNGVDLGTRLRSGEPQPTSNIFLAPEEPFHISILLPDAGSAVVCSLDLGRQPPPDAYQMFAEQIGVDPVGVFTGRRFGLANALRAILRRSLIKTNDTRLMPSVVHGWGPNGDPSSINSEGQIPEALFRLKNGRSSEVQRFRTVQSLFREFTHGRVMDVSFIPSTAEEAGTSPGRGLEVNAVVLVSVDPISEEDLEEPIPQVPIEFAGAGAWEALVLAYVLGRQTSSFIFLDEPAVALHPNLQRKLMNHLLSLSAQVVVVTHSPYLFPLDGDGNFRVVRFDRDDNSATLTYAVDDSVMLKIVPKLRQSGNEMVVFASAAILGEGTHDQAAVRTVAECRNVDLDGSNIAVIDCGSRNNIPDYVHFCDELGLPFLAIQDADASNKGAAKSAQAVRDAVTDSKNGMIFEFPENLESTLGGADKNTEKIIDAVRSTLSAAEVPLDIEKLCEAISGLVEGIS
jgi:energy-coupling factor transporter ATP-binding protein EcfA2